MERKRAKPSKNGVGRKAKPKPTAKKAYTVRDVCAATGLRPGTLREWEVTGKTMRGKDGSFDIASLIKLSHEEGVNLVSLKGGGKKSPAVERAYLKYWRAKAEEKHLDVQIKQGGMVPVNDMIQALVERELIFKNRLMGLADILASRLPGCGPKEIKAVCIENFMSLFRELARNGSEGMKLSRCI